MVVFSERCYRIEMAVGKSVIKQILQERLGEAEETESSKIPLLLSGLVLAQVFGFVGVYSLTRSAGLQEHLGWGFSVGFAISTCLLAVGHTLSRSKSQAPWKILLRDYYGGLAELLGTKTANPTVRDAEAEMLSVLWNAGVVSHRDLEGRLESAGFPFQQVRQALDNLRGLEMVLVRADGVSLGPESKRLFS